MVLGVVYINPKGVRVEMKIYENLEQQVKEVREQGKMTLVVGDFSGTIRAGRWGDEKIIANGSGLLARSTECDM